MKKLIILFFVLICNINSWGQFSIILELGTEVVENNSLNSAISSFYEYGMPLESFPNGNYGCLVDPLRLTATVNVNKNNTIKEVSFLWGFAIDSLYFFDDTFDEEGYTLININKTTLANGVIIPQEIYYKNNVVCIVQIIDDHTRRFIFKRNNNS